MSKYRRRKSKLYVAIERYDGAELSDLSEEDLQTVAGRLSMGYLIFDDSRKGMFVVSTDLGRMVIDRE